MKLNRRRLESGARVTIATALVVGLAVVQAPSGTAANGAPPIASGSLEASTVSGSIQGRVFQDFRSDGTFDSDVVPGQATDIGISGITVRAFDAAGALVGTAVTDTDGTYDLTVTDAASADVRIEFEIPATGPTSAFLSSFSGEDSGTSVQFVSVGDTGVDLGLNVPDEYCQSNPSLAVSRLCAGVSFSPGAPAVNPSVWVTDYEGGPYTLPPDHVGLGGTFEGLTDVYADWTTVTAGQATVTGSILGMAWDPATRRIFNTAYIRRHAELYESGGTPRPGALFVTTPGASGLGGTTAFLVDLETLMGGDQFSNSTPGAIGFIPTNAARKIQCIAWGAIDADKPAGCVVDDGVDSNLVPGKVGVYEAVGQTGIGDIEVDDNGDLYVVSLYTKHLYKVTMPANGSAPTTMVSLGDITADVSCTNGEGRPFSVTRWRGALYLGLTCDGSGDFPANPDDYNPSQTLDTNISFTIRRYDLAAGSWSTFFGPQSLSNQERGLADTTSTAFWPQTARKWNPWTNAYVGPVEINGTDRNVFDVRPVPMLSDIAFDADGSMILGFRDRTGDQLATQGSENPIGGETKFPSVASGDILRVCRTGPGYTASDYSFEGTDLGCPQTRTDFRSGREYYFDDKYGKSRHEEISVGMLKQVPGFPDVIVSVYDPFDDPAAVPIAEGGSNELARRTFTSGGIRYLRNATGGNSEFPNIGSGVIFYARDEVFNPNTEGGFGKTNGMSDVEALCDQAPLQIGNRVWLDTNIDGIQDPGEPPLAGVTVNLYDADGVLVGTAVTNANGEYYFSSNLIDTDESDHIGGGLVPNAEFTLRLDNPDDYLDGGPLYGLLLTDAYQIAPDGSLSSAVDSDAVLVDDYPEIPVPSLAPGFNDHTFDVGFFGGGVSVGDYVWWDTNGDGLQDPTDVPLAGVTLTISRLDGEPVLDFAGEPFESLTTVTDEFGYYSFDGLLAGHAYVVTVTPPAGFVATIAEAGDDPALDSSTDSATSVLLPNDGDRDPTLDFGFVAAFVELGNFVWFDLDKDGVQGDDEPPVVGATLTLTDMDGDPVTDIFGNPVGPQITDDNGEYLFTLLPPGQYRVVIEYPEGYGPTLPGEGDDDDADSSAFVAVSAVLAANESDYTLDFGVVPVVSVGDYVWFDVNGDGLQDETDVPLEGVKLELFLADGVTPATNSLGETVPPAFTDADGYYSFDNLPFGQYVVKVTAPNGYQPTIEAAGSDPALDSSTGSALSADLQAAGERDSTLDFGFVPVPSVSVGDLVWFDTNGNGVQDPGEPGVEGAQLTLRDMAGNPVEDIFGNPVGPIVTDASGNYLFVDLPPGQYQVFCELPSGMVATIEGVGSPDTDSSTSVALSRVLEGGESDLTLDFGAVLEPVPTTTVPEPVVPPSGSLPSAGGGMTRAVTVALWLALAGLVALMLTRRRLTSAGRRADGTG